MNTGDVIRKLMFDYGRITQEEIAEICGPLPGKLIRWLGAHHPDNRTRKTFFRLTGIKIGEDTVINQNFIVSDGYEPLLSIGKRVAISPNVTVICDSNANNSSLSANDYVAENIVKKEPVAIKDDAWIGANVVILPGVTIGEKSVVGAGAVVTADIPPYTVAAGVPAKVIKTLDIERKP